MTYLIRENFPILNNISVFFSLRGTFVQDYDNYWVGVHSKTLSPRDVDTNVFMATNHSMLTNDSIASVVSDIPADSETFSDSVEDVDLNVLIADSEEEYVSNTTVGSQNLDRRNTTRNSRRKVSIKHRSLPLPNLIEGIN